MVPGLTFDRTTITDQNHVGRDGLFAVKLFYTSLITSNIRLTLQNEALKRMPIILRWRRPQMKCSPGPYGITYGFLFFEFY